MQVTLLPPYACMVQTLSCAIVRVPRLGPRAKPTAITTFSVLIQVSKRRLRPTLKMSISEIELLLTTKCITNNPTIEEEYANALAYEYVGRLPNLLATGFDQPPTPVVLFSS